MDTERKVMEYITQHGMLAAGDTCLIGLSGGADSVCLLGMLHRASGRFGYKLIAVHVNHGIRHEEAGRDEAFCENLCRSLSVPLAVYHADVPRLARDARIGEEEMGRAVRRRVFDTYADKYGANRIALAHHKDDCAETFLFHLARGTSIDGLAAIKPVRGRIIRPLLCLSKEEITSYVRAHAVRFVEDSTNADDTYTRNRIRHHVLSYMKREINPRTVEHIAELAAEIDETAAYMEREMCKCRAAFVQEAQGRASIRLAAAGMEPVLLRRLIFSALCGVCGKQKDITRQHVAAVIRLFTGTVGKEISLPHEMTALRTYESVIIFLGDCPVHSGGYEIKSRIFSYHGERIPENKYTKWLDYDKINNNAAFRTRKPGDYLIIDGYGSRKSLGRYMIDEKIPRQKRDQIPVLACGSEVYWVPGYRIAENVKIDSHTKSVIEYRLTGQSPHESGNDTKY